MENCGRQMANYIDQSKFLTQLRCSDAIFLSNWREMSSRIFMCACIELFAVFVKETGKKNPVFVIYCSGGPSAWCLGFALSPPIPLKDPRESLIHSLRNGLRYGIATCCILILVNRWYSLSLLIQYSESGHWKWVIFSDSFGEAKGFI